MIELDPSTSWSTEQLVICSDRELGLRAVIAVDDTSLGNGLGGVRFKRYPSVDAGITEVRRLARAMTLKNAAADLNYGGAKSVILADEPVVDREAFMRRFGEFVARLGGTYLPGVDMGTTTGDLAWMADAGAIVPSINDNPSPATASGVFHAIKAAVAHTLGKESLEDVHVLIQGVGHVGAALAGLLAVAGARLTVSDVDGDRAQLLAGELGAAVVPGNAIIDTECDVFAPCAVARVIDAAVVPRLRCRIVAGAANDTLSSEIVADDLAARQITYVPDFLANAGGVIDIDARFRGLGAESLDHSLRAIGTRVAEVLYYAEQGGRTPLAAAQRYAMGRIAAARNGRGSEVMQLDTERGPEPIGSDPLY